MRRITNTLLIISLLAVGVACQDEETPDVEFIVKESVIVQAEIPTSATPNQVVTLMLWYPGGGCMSVDRTETSFDGYDIALTVFSKKAVNASCTADATVQQIPFTLRLGRPGEYTIHINGWDIPSEYTLTVE